MLNKFSKASLENFPKVLWKFDKKSINRWWIAIVQSLFGKFSKPCLETFPCLFGFFTYFLSCVYFDSSELAEFELSLWRSTAFANSLHDLLAMINDSILTIRSFVKTSFLLLMFSLHIQSHLQLHFKILLLFHLIIYFII